MANRGHIPLLTLVALAFSLALPPVSGDSDGSGDPGTTGCVNIEYNHWGGPLVLQPYADEVIGFMVSDDQLSDGTTLAVIIVPSLCGNEGAGPLGQVIAAPSSALPGPPGDSGVAGLP